jgi:hypothetical protein
MTTLEFIRRQLAEVYTPEGVEIWLNSRNQSLDGRRPIDILAEGDFSTVRAAVERLTRP